MVSKVESDSKVLASVGIENTIENRILYLNRIFKIIKGTDSFVTDAVADSIQGLFQLMMAELNINMPKLKSFIAAFPAVKEIDDKIKQLFLKQSGASAQELKDVYELFVKCPCLGTTSIKAHAADLSPLQLKPMLPKLLEIKKKLASASSASAAPTPVKEAEAETKIDSEKEQADTIENRVYWYRQFNELIQGSSLFNVFFEKDMPPEQQAAIRFRLEKIQQFKDLNDEFYKKVVAQFGITVPEYREMCAIIKQNPSLKAFMIQALGFQRNPETQAIQANSQNIIKKLLEKILEADVENFLV